MARILKIKGKGIYGYHSSNSCLFPWQFSVHIAPIFPFCQFIPIYIKISYPTYLCKVLTVPFLKTKEKASFWVHISLQSHFSNSLFSKTLLKSCLELCLHFLSLHSLLNSYKSHFYPHNSTDSKATTDGIS